MSAGALSAGLPLTRRHDRAQQGFWALYDLGTASLGLLVATDALNRFGLSSFAWLLVYALVLMRLLLGWRGFFDCTMRNLQYVAFPALCLASALWSYAPATTLVTGAQLAVTTLLAMFVGWRFSLRDICLLVFLVLGGTVWLSIANLLAGGVLGPSYDEAGLFCGIFTHKHMLAQRALFAMVSAFAILFLRLPAYGGALKLFALLSIPVFALATVMSSAVTSILLEPVFAGLLLLLCVRQIPRPLVLAGAMAGLLVLSFGPFLAVAAGFDPVGETLDAFGKSASMTGRTRLWDMGLRAAGEHGLLGVGYNGFWSAPAFRMWALYAQEIGGETVRAFHNFLIEVVVATGVAGLLAMLLLVGTTLLRSARLLLRTGSAAGAYGIAVTLAAVALSLLGTSLYRQHEIMYVVVIAVGVSAARALPRAPRPPP